MGYRMDTHAVLVQLQLVKNSRTQLTFAKQRLCAYQSEISTIYQSSEQRYLLQAINQSIISIQTMLDRCAVLQEQLSSLERASTSNEGRW